MGAHNVFAVRHGVQATQWNLTGAVNSYWTIEIRKPSRGAGSAFDSSLGEAVASNKRGNGDA
jgi:hypothetical protein